MNSEVSKRKNHHLTERSELAICWHIDCLRNEDNQETAFSD